MENVNYLKRRIRPDSEEFRNYLNNLKVGDNVYWKSLDNDQIIEEVIQNIQYGTNNETKYFISEDMYLVETNLLDPNSEEVMEYLIRKNNKILKDITKQFDNKDIYNHFISKLVNNGFDEKVAKNILNIMIYG